MATRKSAKATEPSTGEIAAPKHPPKEKALSCGLVMPISAIDGCTAEHWAEVKNIVTEAVEGIADPKFAVRLVSDSDDVGVIQKRIVQNVYSSDIIVCDVSGKNPNVMFELGMRLAFDKPTVIIKDDKTDYSFDTAIIEHVGYPRDLRFSRVVTFKSSLADKVLATHRAATKDPNHSTFLKSFGKFQVATLSEDVVPADKLVIDMLQELQSDVARLRRGGMRAAVRSPSEAAAALAATYVKYATANPGCTPSELIGQDSFYRFVIHEIDAPKFFERRTDFESAIDDFLRQMSNRSEGKE